MPLVPALFVIGDSTADVGTNNYLGTLARADREPYGRDFDTHRPTGRFSNGRIPVDYIGNKAGLRGLLPIFVQRHYINGLCAAERLGLPFVPPYLEQNMRTGAADVGLTNIDGMIQGVNYVSAAAGIISSSGSELVYIHIILNISSHESHYLILQNLMLTLARQHCHNLVDK